MTELFAQPYDLSAQGFYFTSADEFWQKSATALNAFHMPVEEYEIQFIDGDAIDEHLFEALGINQANFGSFLGFCESWDEQQKQKVIIAVGECGYSFNMETGDPDGFDLDLYEIDSLRELAQQFVDDGLFGQISDRLRYYLDYDAIARDLSVDYSETTIAGNRFIYRCF